MTPLKFVIDVNGRTVKYMKGSVGKREEATLKLYTRTTARLSPAAREFRQVSQQRQQHARHLPEEVIEQASIGDPEFHEHSLDLVAQVYAMGTMLRQEPEVRDYLGADLMEVMTWGQVEWDQLANGHSAMVNPIMD